MKHGDLSRTEAARSLRAYRERMRPAWEAAATDAERRRQEREALRRELAPEAEDERAAIQEEDRK